MWHLSFIRVTWLIHMWHNWLICGLAGSCETRPIHTWQGSLIYDMTPSHVIRLIYATRLVITYCVILFMNPTLGNCYGPGVPSKMGQLWRSTHLAHEIVRQHTSSHSLRQPGVGGLSPSTSTTSLPIPIPSSSSSNGLTLCLTPLTTRGYALVAPCLEAGLKFVRPQAHRWVSTKWPIHSGQNSKNREGKSTWIWAT